MIAFFGGRPADALDLARQASEYADTALHRAQITAWCELSALAALGHHDEPGRFGFDHTELHQHLAEAFLQLGDTRLSAGNHATPPEGPGCRPAQRTPAGSCLPRPARPAANAAHTHTPAQRTSPEPNGGNPRCTGLPRCISDAHPELGKQLVSAGHVQPLAHPGYSPDLAEADVP
jgi:hypothetical protein